MGTARVGRNDLCPCGSGKKHKNCCINKPKRKYMSEFALHAYTSHCIMFYPHDLKKLKFDQKFHIYMINMIPKLTYIKDSLEVTKEKIRIDMTVKTAHEEKIRRIDFDLEGVTDHRTLSINFNESSKTMEIIDSQGQGWLARALNLYRECTEKELESEILYIGQSFGSFGDRTAQDRLLAHSTLQQIQSDFLFNEPIGDLAISLLEFTPNLLTTFDGVSKDYEMSNEEDTTHMMKVLGSEPCVLHSQMINVIEAALINYFKPEYNAKYKDNFPRIEHLGYKHYYDLDYNSIQVEIDTYALNSNIFTKHTKYSDFNMIKYPLHSEETRKNMFKYFD